MSLNSLFYPGYTPGLGSRPRLHSTHPFRNLVAAGSTLNNQWYGGSDHSGYGFEHPEYDYYSGPSSHVPSGGSYSYQATAGTGYGPPAAPHIHHTANPGAGDGGAGKKGIFGGGGGRRGSSVMSAVTLLSFLFFINLLQGCIKDHMDAMNPTVMVMTPTIIRNRFNKMGEMNSREQSSTYTSNGANIVMQPADLVAAAAAQHPPVIDTTRPLFSLNTPYQNNPIAYNKPMEQMISQPPLQYVENTAEPDVSIKYGKPQYDPHKPDKYDQQPHLPQLPTYANHSLTAKPPPYTFPFTEHHHNHHHTEFYAQPSSRPFQSTLPPNSFHEHQSQAIAAKPYNDDTALQHGLPHQDYAFRQMYEMAQQQQSPNYQQPSYSSAGHPWSSNLQTSSSAVSGPFRRASVVAVAPKSRWMSVPTKAIDHVHFDADVADIEGVIEHHNDREVFHTTFT